MGISNEVVILDDWTDAVIDAGIYAGAAFFTALGVAVGDGVIHSIEIWIAAIAAGGEFFGFLMLKRGLREKE